MCLCVRVCVASTPFLNFHSISFVHMRNFTLLLSIILGSSTEMVKKSRRIQFGHCKIREVN